jgi:hypothetical protein
MSLFSMEKFDVQCTEIETVLKTELNSHCAMFGISHLLEPSQASIPPLVSISNLCPLTVRKRVSQLVTIIMAVA